MSREVELGTLIVVVLKARNLKDKHSFYKQDVFAQATLNGTTQKTPVDIKGGQHPVWDAELRFPVMKGVTEKCRKLEVACFSKERISDDLLGKATVDITEMLKTGEFDEWVSLSVEGVVRGDLYLEMTYYSNASTSVASLGVPTNTPTRRPSKFTPAEKLYRLPQAPSSPPPTSLIDNRIHSEMPSRSSVSRPPEKHTDTSSLHSSRSSTYALSMKRSESPLPPLPEQDLPSDHPPLVLFPGNGRLGVHGNSPQREPSPQTGPPDFPVTLRPGHRVTSSQGSGTRSRASSSSSSSSQVISAPPVYGSPINRYQAPPTPPYTLSQGPPSVSPPALTVPHAPPAKSTISQTRVSDPPPNPFISFPIPTIPVLDVIDLYPSKPEKPFVYQPPPPRNDLPDPYLQARYQTPLALPPSSGSPFHGYHPSPHQSRSSPSPDRLEDLRLAEKEAARRKEQEDKDLALALQLDRELNL